MPDDANKYFYREVGKHVVQRIPPTERNGRRQTSVITVAITFPFQEIIEPLNLQEVEITPTRGSGPGGQHRNKVESAIRAVHIPTGISVFIDGRNQHHNKKEALEILAKRVSELKANEQSLKYTMNKRQQVGDGGRSDKVRTYNFLESRVTDHKLGIKTAQIDKIMKGGFEIFYDI